MIEGRKLAIYAFLTEIGACDAKLMVFERDPEPTRYDVAFVLEAALSTETAGLIQNMLVFLGCSDRRYFLEKAIILAAHEYMRLPWADNTFRERFIALETSQTIEDNGSGLPF